MVNGHIDLARLNLDELNGVVNLYPWFGAARKELCRRMSELGEGAWSDERYADAALYVGSRRIIAELARRGHGTDFSGDDVRELLHSYIDSGIGEIREERRIVRVGGDYFSEQQYESVRRDGDNVFSSFAKVDGTSGKDLPDSGTAGNFADICTETLAQIYAEQGYPEQARQIYSRLSLRFPEKSSYFAGLIEKL